MKTLSLAGAASLLKPGMVVFIHGTATEPRTLVDYLAANTEHLRGVHVISSFIPGVNTVQLAGLAPDCLQTNTMAQAPLNSAVADGTANVLRLAYSELPRFLTELGGIDLCFIHSGAASGGRFSTGITGELIPNACALADKICLLSNSAMPVPESGCAIDEQRVDFIVNTREELVVYPVRDAIDDTSATIARRVAALVRDGDTVQAGIGVIPVGVFRLLTRRRNLRVFSGMISNETRTLAESGALDSDATHIYGMALGSHEFYRWLDKRSGFGTAGVDVTHDRSALARIDNFVTINGAIEVALDGSVNAECIGAKTVSGPGGLPDYAIGASTAAHGRSVIALPAANLKHGVSRIVPTLSNHDSPTVAGGIVTHIVTEYGTAELQGTTLAERAERLTAIAHPDFRASLRKATEAFTG